MAYDGSKVSLKRVYLNSGGNEFGKYGRYWGIGAPLYHALSDDYEIDMYTRAMNREDAKKEVLAKFPTAKFYR